MSELAIWIITASLAIIALPILIAMLIYVIGAILLVILEIIDRVLLKW